VASQFSFVCPAAMATTELGQRYWVSFIICGILCFVLQIISRNSTSKNTNASNTKSSTQFPSFQFNYLIIFLLAMFSDWLQGPYVYELYVSYGFTQQQIAELFVCGFGSSMLVGTFVGALADKWGRKLMCITYCVCYILACLTKLVPDYKILMIGRFLSGIATSLLFSVFESWMVCEHNKQGYDSYLLGETFSYATFGNGLVAVCAGLTANSVADSFGYVAPFVVAMLPLSIVGLMIFFTWNENYGNNSLGDFSSLARGFDLVRNDSRIAALGLAQSSFEGAMYTFVFMWTPALKSVEETEAEINGVELQDSTSEHLGLIFAVFMVCVMVGSSFFKLLSVKRDMLYRIPLILHALAFFAMGSTALFLDIKVIVYSMFLLFEMTVGLFYPAYGVIKSEKIPEEIRSAVMNIFRFLFLSLIPLPLLSLTLSLSHHIF
jgi:MFS transporter, MFS domain-containing protein family, molybdate-anion transporter